MRQRGAQQLARIFGAQFPAMQGHALSLGAPVAVASPYRIPTTSFRETRQRLISTSLPSRSGVLDGHRLADAGILQSGAHIGGDWVPAAGSKTFDVLNPATGKPIASVADCGAAETEAAIAAAAAAFPAWAARPAKDRAAIMRRWHELIIEAKDDITALMTLECGKPLAEARNEFDGGAESIVWFAEEGRRVEGEILAPPDRNRRFMVLRQPVGVCAAVTPWNFPFSMITRKTAPALAVGCTVVLKPSELTPLTALALAELARRAGMPAGVFNVVPTAAAAAVGDTLMASPVVRKIGFTGSTRVGKVLYAAAADTVKRVSLELGGNAPFIVFPDADLDRAARAAAASSYRNAGQTCICTNRVLVHDAVHDEFAKKLVDRVAALRLGAGIDPGTTHGPLITSTAVDRLEEKIEAAAAAGARVAAGGRRPSLPAPLSGGFFFEPTVLTDVDPDMRIFAEESFGPVTPITRFSSEEEAIALANSTPYGLAAYLYTQDLSRSWRAAEGLTFGMVGVNEVAITSEVAPFGGVKESGLGREHSRHGVDEYLDMKTVCIGL